MNNTAVIYIAHCITDETTQRFRKMSEDLSGVCDVFWALQVEDTGKNSDLPKDIPFYVFSLASIRELGYESFYEDSILGSVNFILQRFYRDHPQYALYWSVEYDVVFTGDWRTLVDAVAVEVADFVSCHIERYNEKTNGGWDWWTPLCWADEEIPQDECVKAFNPIFSLSAKALEYLDDFLGKGNYGHFEALMSTALYRQGFKLLDMGGMGEFTPSTFRNRFYVQGAGVNNGTMRFRPEFLREEIMTLGVKDKLFHPLK